MQAKIGPTKSILKALRYNEQKVSEGKAEKIKAENFLKDHDRLTRDEILDRFRQRSSFNEQMQDDGVHFSLNFGKQEPLANDKLAQLADRYMAGMGFEDQPYVVYKHVDAGHTHLHVVATSVRANGARIDLHPRNYLDSVLLCKRLEKEFSLEKLAGVRPEQQAEFAVDHAQQVRYGDPGLKHAISDVLNTVVDHYNYTSLEELNAILKQYNVAANPGRENSHLNKVGGLLYQALDDDGNRIGVPIKASLFLLKPTLKNLEQRFTQNQALREEPRERLSTAIEWALAGRAPDWTGFKATLEKEGITVVIDKNKQGEEKVFFVDHAGKSAFEGKDLGKEYSFESLRNRCAPEEQISQQQIEKQQLNLHI